MVTDVTVCSAAKGTLSEDTVQLFLRQIGTLVVVATDFQVLASCRLRFSLLELMISGVCQFSRGFAV